MKLINEMMQVFVNTSINKGDTRVRFAIDNAAWSLSLLVIPRPPSWPLSWARYEYFHYTHMASACGLKIGESQLWCLSIFSFGTFLATPANDHVLTL